MEHAAEIAFAEIPKKVAEIHITETVGLKLKKTERVKLMEPSQAIEIPENERATWLHTANMAFFRQGGRFSTRKQPDGRVLLIRLS